MKDSPIDRMARLRGWRATLTLMALGAASSLALPPLNVVPVLLVTVPALLAMVAARPGWRGAFAAGFWFGLGHHMVGLYWITEAIMFEAARFWWLVPVAVPALSAVLAAFIAVPCAVARLSPPGWPRVLVFAGTWVLAELVRQFLATGFPWNPWGSVWAIPGPVGDVMLQVAGLAGVHGMTLATVLLAATPVLGRRAMAGGLAVMLAWAGYGTWRLSVPAGPPPGLAVVLVQGNVPQGQKWDRALVNAIFARYLGMTQAALREVPPGPAVVVWPETASPYLLDHDDAARSMISTALYRPEGPAASALIGTVRFDAAQRPYNSLAALLGPEPPAGMYDKWHLVPFGEFQPSWFPLPIQVVPGGGFASGPGPQTLRVPGLPAVGPAICYEVIYSGQVVDRADRPEWIVTVTNDAWFGNSTGPRQHLAAARMRAVEEGMPLMRAANTGISAAYDAFGRELGRIGMNEAGFLNVMLPGRTAAPPFARTGLWLPLALALITVAAGMVLGRRTRE
jgi:apolipoprotein N-acyltransferase